MRYLISVADGSGMTTLADALAVASARGMTKLVVSVSLVGGYDEHDSRERWTAVGVMGATENLIASRRGHTFEDAVISVLAELGVIQ